MWSITRPHASSINSFMMWTLAFTSRIWSCVNRAGTKPAGPPSMFGKRPSQKASQCSGLRAKMARIASSDPG